MLNRKVISVVLLVSLLLPMTTLVLSYQLKKSQIRHEVKQKMKQLADDSELVLIAIQKDDVKSQLEWEHDKEFEYRGEMYDVIKTQESADSVFYYCWWDQEETKLNVELKTNVFNALGLDESQQKKKESLKKLFQLYCFEGKSNMALSNLKLDTKKSFKYLNTFSNWEDSPASPPPIS